jgi:excalibur calcium-binding domain-containing protein
VLYRRLGGLVAGGIVGAASLRLPATNERQAPASHPVPHYRDCHAARVAGTAPLFRGEPGYEPRLDADNDGIACEPLPRR